MTTATKKRPLTSSRAGLKPGELIPDSLVSRICAMSVGASESRSICLPIKKATAEAISEAKENAGVALRVALSRAKKRCDFEFTQVSTGDFRTSDDQVCCTAVVTRLK